MIELLAQYGLFLAKTLTILVSAIVILSTIFALSSKGKKEDGTLLIQNLNEKMENIHSCIQTETLSKADRKKWQKRLKQQDKDKKKLKKAHKDELKEGDTESPRLFVLDFDGDMRASAVVDLRETISAIIQSAAPQDEVLIKLESGGGFVHSYGLAASQLQRLRDNNINLTVAIDKIAASGGYMMACVGNHIIAAPFAIVGSIGVVAQLPNFHKLLEKHHVDYEMHTAGQYKRTLTMFGKNTDKGRHKFQEEIEETHLLFKDYIAARRPQVDIEKIATGEHWHAIDAIKRQLIDHIQTSDDFILNKMKSMQVFELTYEHKQKFVEKIAGSFSSALEKLVFKLFKDHFLAR